MSLSGGPWILQSPQKLSPDTLRTPHDWTVGHFSSVPSCSRVCTVRRAVCGVWAKSNEQFCQHLSQFGRSNTVISAVCQDCSLLNVHSMTSCSQQPDSCPVICRLEIHSFFPYLALIPNSLFQISPILQSILHSIFVKQVHSLCGLQCSAVYADSEAPKTAITVTLFGIIGNQCSRGHWLFQCS